MPEARAEVLREGGHAVGDAVALETADRRRVTWYQVTDPERHVADLRFWA